MESRERRPEAKGDVNWRRGFRRIFWIVSAAWWIGAAVWLASNITPMPTRDEFEPRCYPSWSDDAARRTCGSAPQYQPSLGALLEPGANRQSLEREARSDWDRRRNEHASCVAAADLAELTRRAECEARRDGPDGQRAITEAHQKGVLSWSGQILLAAAVLAIVPFVLAALLLGLSRMLRWVRDGFRPST
jgi:hypothetical protein